MSMAMLVRVSFLSMWVGMGACYSTCTHVRVFVEASMGECG